MKEVDRHNIDVPEEILADFGTGFRLEFRRHEMQSGADQIEIHAYQPAGKEQHRFSRFRIVDEDNGVVAFLKSNHDRPDPYQMALLGLNIEGWETRKNWELDHTEEYANRGQLNQQGGMLLLGDAREMHPFDAEILRQAAVYQFLAGAVYHFHAEHDDKNIGEMLDERGIDALGLIELSGAEEVKELTQDTMREHLREYLTAETEDTE